MLELQRRKKRENMKETIHLAQKLEEILENLYDSTRYYNIVDHALVAYLLRREKEVLRELPDNPRNLREALATLLVTDNAKHALKAVEILEKRYKKRLKNTFPYSVIALDILLDKGFFEPAKRLYIILDKTHITNITAPSEDAYILFAIFERTARSLGILFVNEELREKPDQAFRTMVDFVIRGKRKVLNYTEYRSILGWINAQLKEKYYTETYDDIETFNAEIPPPLFFSPARLYVVWKFLLRTLKFKVVPPSYVLDDSTRQILIDTLKKKRQYERYKLKFLNFVENFLLTIAVVVISITVDITTQAMIKIAVPLPFIATIIVGAIVGAIEKYTERKLRKFKLYVPGFSIIENKRKKVELRLNKIEKWLEKYTKILCTD